uniref:membrane protein insertion efficiency factor YidD n=1 Tax=Staphylococcus hominis TaxID=1290 RepID=UPI00119F2FFB
LSMIGIYEGLISRMTGGRCGLYGSCCEYSKEGIEVYGGFKGGYMGVKGILKWDGFDEGGFDGVGLKKEKDRDDD